MPVFGQDGLQAGPLYDTFPLTLAPGHREEALGPLYYNQQSESDRLWALPPFYSRETDSTVKMVQDDYLYPIMTYRRYGTEYRWQFIELFSIAGGKEPSEFQDVRRFTLFPIYFQQRSPLTNDNYTALVPFYGHLKERLFRDDIFFVMFPIYGETRKKDVINDNYLYPFFNTRHGDGMRGWQFWPIIGKEHKVLTVQTNNWGDAITNAGHDHLFVLWPIHFRQNNGIGTDNPEKIRADIPFYFLQRSPQRDSTSALWPFFTWINDRGQKYREWQMPWPFVIIARGEGKTTTRVFPLFSQAHNSTFVDNFYLWPLYKYNAIHSDPLARQRTRILFFLYQNTKDKNTGTGKEKQRVDLWPFFVYHRDFEGNNRLQLLAPLETFVPDNPYVERDWSPLWSVWRAENNVKTGASSQSLLWNLYRRDTAPDTKKISLLFGLFQYQSTAETKKMRLFFIPVINSHKQTVASAN
ncbi:MAG TPA: hypothetical protein VGN23_03715 [Verrucomicrobiae bacterium]|jgi:hypothetical protein